MADILFVKTSSLGDVIHHMPAMMEARVHRPGHRFSWVVEEAFAPLVRLHPAADDVIPVSARRWSRRWFEPSTWSEMAAFRRGLRGRRFDVVIDTQGLVKSALMARCARGVRHGYDAASIKEPWASRLYDERHPVSRDLHAIERNRALTGAALGYRPDGPPDYGLDRTRLAAPGGAPYAVLLHATAQMQKEWPEDRWRALAADLARNIDVVLPWGSDAERVRAERIASSLARVSVADRQPLDAVARLIAGAAFVVGVDTGLLHLAAALQVPLVGVFCGSDPRLTAPVGSAPIAVIGSRGASPSLAEVSAGIEAICGAMRIDSAGRKA
jgi:heptosyltransferase-1